MNQRYKAIFNVHIKLELTKTLDLKYLAHEEYFPWIPRVVLFPKEHVVIIVIDYYDVVDVSYIRNSEFVSSIL